MANANIIGPYLRRERMRAGLNQTEAAELIGLTSAALCNWENGRAKPPLEELLKLRELYGCTMDVLLGRVA